MSKHTPGPWLIEKAGELFDADNRHAYFSKYNISCGSTKTSHENYYRIASVSNANNSSQNWQNAVLIAAAPDLLEALEDCVNRMRSYLGLLKCDDEFIARETQIASAAIAKATGAAS